eukprot:gene4918-5565_t
MDKKLVGGILASLNAPSLMSCSNKCTSSQGCQTFNYKQIKGSFTTSSKQINCELLSKTKESSEATLTTSAGWMHYEPVLLDTPQCPPNTCPSGYKCIASCTKKSGYDCVDIDECASNPCKNSGLCTNGVNKYTCSCVNGYSGKRCENFGAEQWLSGHGSGGTELYIGTYATKQACMLECSKRSNGSVYANGATYMDIHSHCFCEFGMAGRTSSSLHQSSYISPSCTSYTELTSQDRNVNTGYGEICDNTLPVASYRFTGSAGVKMPTSCIDVYHCKTQMPGWMEGTETTQSDGVVTRKVCFNYVGNCCGFSKMIRVRNCGTFFVYELVPTMCNARYCGKA